MEKKSSHLNSISLQNTAPAINTTNDNKVMDNKYEAVHTATAIK